MKNHLRETPEDREVKSLLWEATKRELMFFAGRYAEEHIKGERESDAQYDVAAAAKKKLYPMTVVRRLGSCVRRDVDTSAILDEYRAKIGLLA